MKINQSLFDNLLKKAVTNPRLRQNFDLRSSPADTSQRMLNALLPGAQVPIHRHTKSTETIVILQGKMEEIYYEIDENSHRFIKEIKRITLSADGPVQGLSIPLGQWHSLNIIEPTVLFECKDGIYEPLCTEDIIG